MNRRWFVGRSLLGLVTLPWLACSPEEEGPEGEDNPGAPESGGPGPGGEDDPGEPSPKDEGDGAPKEPEGKEPEGKEPEGKDPEGKDPGGKEPEGKDPEDKEDPKDEDEDCDDPFKGGELLGVVPFIRESGALGKKVKSGHDARVRFDLSKLTEENMVCAAGEHFVRTEYPNKLDENKTWKIRVHGKIDEEIELSMEDLQSMPQISEVICMECSGNTESSRYGLLSAAKWTGVPFAEVLKKVSLKSDATSVLIGGFDERTQSSTHSTPGASWIFTLEQLAKAGAFLAIKMNDEPLPKDHGKPVRLMVPGWYGCASAKWMDEIRFVGSDEPSTPQMREFASRTLQRGVPKKAKDFRPASIDQSAMPVRVEKWKVKGEILYKVVGIMWGGYEVTDALTIKFGSGSAQPVKVCPKQSQNRTWTLWSHAYKPSSTGNVTIRMAIADKNIPTRRLDRGDYRRTVKITEV